MKTMMYQLVMVSVTILLGCTMAMTGWGARIPAIDPMAADTDPLPPVDETYLSLLLVCW
jgi:hypothetical protein